VSNPTKLRQENEYVKYGFYDVAVGAYDSAAGAYDKRFFGREVGWCCADCWGPLGQRLSAYLWYMPFDYPLN